MAQPANDTSDDPERRRIEQSIVLVALIAMAVGYGLAVDGGTTRHYDHGIFEVTLRFQREGVGFYDAYLEAFRGRGVEIAEARGVRQPLIFLLWRWIPASLLWPSFLAVAVGIAALMMDLTKRAVVTIPVLAYLLTAGRIPSAETIDQWLLVELWAVLPLTASIVCWRRDRHAAASVFAVVAVLIREIALGYVVLALLFAWRRGRNQAMAWTVGLVIAVAGYIAHLIAVQGHLAPVGNEAEIVGTGDPPRTIFEMVAWMVPGPSAVGVVVFGVALHQLTTRRHDLLPLAGLFALAGAGLLVARPYWGFLFIPFAVLLAGERLGDVLTRDAGQPEAEPSSARPTG